MEKELTTSGYLINKNLLQKNTLEKIRKDLTITINDKFTGNTDEYTILTETEKDITVPKYYGETNFKNFKTISNINHTKINPEFKGKLRDYQEDIINTCKNHFTEKSTGIIVLSCGLGKTCIALYLSCMLKLKTLVIVDKNFLQDQWIERIQEYTTASYGILKGSIIDTDKDIVVGMVQSISKKNYNTELFKQFGFVIYDECHTVASKIFCKMMKKTCSKFNIGLTATPYRNDDLFKVINWYIGDPIVNMSRKPTNNVLVKRFFYYPENDRSCFRIIRMRKRGGESVVSTPKMTSNISKCNERNEFIISLIKSLSKTSRRILLLGERVDNIKFLKEEIDEYVKQDNLLITTGLYIGKMKQKDLEESSKTKLIFSNYKMASTGLDIDSLDTLIFVNGKKDVVQSIGRILRKPVMKGNNIPLIIDIIDMFSCYLNWGTIRSRYYKKQKYTVTNYNARGKKLLNPYQELKKDKFIDSGDKKKLGELRNLYKEKYNLLSPFNSSLSVKEFAHSNNIDKVLETPLCEEDEKIKVINNIQ